MSRSLADDLPERIESVDELEDLLSTPSEPAIEALRTLDGDLLLLGVGGKMGPTLARMAVRANEAAGRSRTIYGVARFSRPGLEERLRGWGIETVRCDLLDRESVARLPRAPNILWLAGRKFGTSHDAAATWAMNVIAPAFVTDAFRGARTVAFSTGNVYPLVPIESGGSREEDELAPDGEYGRSALGRERVFEYASVAYGSPTAILRLNYAVEMRYGVLVDIACRVRDGETIDLSMGHVNVIWQADANAAALAAFQHARSPARTMNLAGPEILRVRDVANRFGELLGRAPRLEGEESPDALLNNGARGRELWGPPRVGAERIIEWIADWIARGQPLHGLPTHFEERSGAF